MTTLVSFLGGGYERPKDGYRSTTYALPNGPLVEAPCIGLALAKHLEVTQPITSNFIKQLSGAGADPDAVGNFREREQMQKRAAEHHEGFRRLTKLRNALAHGLRSFDGDVAKLMQSEEPLRKERQRLRRKLFSR